MGSVERPPRPSELARRLTPGLISLDALRHAYGRGGRSTEPLFNRPPKQGGERLRVGEEWGEESEKKRGREAESEVQWS